MAKTATTYKPADGELTDEAQAAYDARVAAQSALDSSPEGSKAKRKTLSPEEKIAKLEAELKAARDKAEAKANKAKTEASEKRATLVAKRDDLDRQIRDLTRIIGDEPATEGSES